MSAGANRNFGIAVRERERRLAELLDDPYNTSAGTAISDPTWNAFYGGLREKEAGARAAGLNFVADTRGLGRFDAAPDPNAFYSTSRQSQLGNVALGQLVDEARRSEFDRRISEAAAQQAEAGASIANRDVLNRDILERSLVQPPEAHTITHDGNKYSIRPAEARGPLVGVPGGMVPAVAAKLAEQGFKERQLGIQEDKAAAAEKAAAAAAEAAKAAMLTPDGVELAARNYLQTGAMPPLGMGDKSSRQRILDRAAQMSKDESIGLTGNVALNTATYKGDADSLKKMQTQRDAIGAFEQTAMKNIDIFLDAAGKVVDTGSPLINAVARGVTGKMLGSPNQAQYDAARLVAVNEIAKITSNPNLTGQLSDSARHEVEAFNPKTATLGQTVAVMRLLKQDMANRTGSLDEAITNIKGRIARPGAAASHGEPLDVGAKMVKMRAPNGATRDVPADQVEHFKGLGASVVR